VLPDLLQQGRELKTIGDAYGTPTFASDLAVRLRQIAGKNASGIFHTTNSGPGVSYFEFASDAAVLLGKDPQLIKNISQNDLQRPAARPFNSRLKCNRTELFGLAPLRDWRNALAEFLGIVS
jgi:dTDP-4-dehydrorhamnose reductase